MSSDEEMMIGDGVGHEIMTYLRRGLHPYLRAAEVGFELTTLQRHIDRQHALHVAAHLEKRVVAYRQIAVDRYTDTRLEMRRIFMLLGHTQGQRTVCEQHLAVGLDTCRIDLEA